MTSHHARQPAPLLGDEEVPASPKLGFHLLELDPQPLLDGDAPEPEAPVLRLPADVREAQEIERLRFRMTTLFSVRRREAAELDEAGLVRVQLQVELREPLAKIMEELLCVTEMLEPAHEVVGEARDDHVATGVPAPPLLDPAVEDVVEVHVREKRRDHPSYNLANKSREIALVIPRTTLRPRYGEGFLGAPLRQGPLGTEGAPG